MFVCFWCSNTIYYIDANGKQRCTRCSIEVCPKCAEMPNGNKCKKCIDYDPKEK